MSLVKQKNKPLIEIDMILRDSSSVITIEIMDVLSKEPHLLNLKALDLSSILLGTLYILYSKLI